MPRTSAACLAVIPPPAAQPAPVDVDHPWGPLTVAEAVEKYIARKTRVSRWSPGTIERTGGDLRKFAQLGPNKPIGAVDGRWMRRYLSAIEHLRVASQRSRWHAVVEFLGWCTREGLLGTNPKDRVGRDELPWCSRNSWQDRVGKEQLTETEAAKYLAAANRLGTPMLRIAAALPLLTGMRSGEIRNLLVRDIDIRAGDIWLRRKLKTKSARRTVSLPESLQTDVMRLCGTREGVEALFRSRYSPIFDRKWLNRLVRQVCEMAGIPVVCAHALRGTYSTLLAKRARLRAPEIATLLGHADGGSTAIKHYINEPEHRPALTLIVGGGEPASVAASQLSLRLLDGGRAK